MMYSICITNYNKVQTLRDALDSILNQIDERFEVVVVDNSSDDGSFEILQDYARDKKIKLFTQKERNRGLGRQNAFLHSTGKWIISGLDTDDICLPRLCDLLKFYHETCEGKILSVKRTGVTVATRNLILQSGGWRDLQRYENWELFRRIAMLNLYSWTIFLITGKFSQHSERRNRLGRVKHYYECYLNSFRLKHRFSDEGQKPRKIDKIAFLLARISAFFYPSYTEGKIGFTSYEHEYYVDSSAWWPSKSDLDDKTIQEWYKRYELPLPRLFDA